MRAFADLFQNLDASNATGDKIAELIRYFQNADPVDAVAAIKLLSGVKQKRVVSATDLKRLIGIASGLPDWLVDDCYAQVGDLAETCTLLCARGRESAINVPLHHWTETLLPALAKLPIDEREQTVLLYWRTLVPAQAFIFNKMLTGALRVGVAQGLLVRALAGFSGLPIDLMAHRLTGGPPDTALDYLALLAPADAGFDKQRPYPFFLASALADAASISAVELSAQLGEACEWQAEWKWDGIRAQLIRRAGQTMIWSRGEERMDGRFPELEKAALALPDGTVLDGEILAWLPSSERPADFTLLQKRIGKLKPAAKLLSDAPVRFRAYDLLELAGQDCRHQPLTQRRAQLNCVLDTLAHPAISLSQALVFDDFDELAAHRLQARSVGVEGLMLKRRNSAYQQGRKRGDWWKWKLDPLSIDAVMIYAQAGHGKRANLYTDYTFALWHNGALVTIAKAYSGLTDAEIAELDRWIKQNTKERFGPVRTVNAEQVFELGFEAINASARHKSGVALRFPRILRWRRDKTAAQADQLSTLQALALGLKAGDVAS